LVSAKVTLAPDVVGPEVKGLVNGLKAGEILLLENVRFYAEEEGKAKLADDATEEQIAAAKAEMKVKQDAFAKELASYGDVYVSDAFGTAHRAHASMVGVTKYIDQCAAGFLLEKEIEYLGNALENPQRPFVAIIGGAKISGKIDVVTNLLGKCDAILIGGGMAYTFYKAMGKAIGSSLCEDDKVELAGQILKQAEEKGVKLLLPIDNVVADAFSAEANVKEVGDSIDDGWMALDIGPKTIEMYCKEVAGAKTVVWNGPMGCFEMAPFAKGTFSVCEAVAKSDSISIIGGGDSVAAVNLSGVADQMSHVSTGGGASLEFMEGKQLPGIVALTDK
jgi:phosphoglycerate kinase